ncbi:hypothetical protein V6N12_058320 [Hibiscus sabdariffa]|uniref:CCHC-type domain-containing protein n=1 Tax=Hibiscus sabdariffa TaxID=183260 RepID=A0ABR2EUE9_9ROSI
MDMDHAAPTPPMQTSFKDKLLGSDSTKHPMETEEALEDDDIEILEGDVIRSMVDGVISIEFSERIQTLAVKSLDQTVVVKLLGRRIGYETLRNKMYELWKSEQPFKLMDIENGYFIVTFRSHLDFLHVLTDGPWLVFGHYLTIEPWAIDFSPAKPYPNKVVAWIRLPGLPITLYKCSLLTKVGNCIDRVIKLDYQTEEGCRCRFARMAISVDLRKPLASIVVVNARTQLVEYESLSTICFACGTHGHTRDSCPTLIPPSENAHNSDVGVDQASITPPQDPFGPWMVIKRRQLQPQKKPSSIRPHISSINIGSRFSPLEVDNDVDGVETPALATD